MEDLALSYGGLTANVAIGRRRYDGVGLHAGSEATSQNRGMACVTRLKSCGRWNSQGVVQRIEDMVRMHADLVVSCD